MHNLNEDNYIEYKPFEFKGKANEFFKIWIVNIFLTIITLGIYSAWAKVRNNRYIYANTYLNNSNFEYNANPKRILIGRIIIVSFYTLFYLFSDILELYKIALGIFLVFLALLPWLIRQAIRFRLKSTTYRNIHFKYMGKTWSFYKLLILVIFLFIVYIGANYLTLKIFGQNIGSFISSLILSFILIPLVYREYKSLIINHSYYGNEKFNFNATKKDTIAIFFSIAIITFIFFLVFGIAIWLGSIIFKDAISEGFNSQNEQIILSLISFLIFSLAVGFYKGLADGYLSNFTRDNTTLGIAKFKGEIEPIKLGFISATNSIAIIISFGLLYPWAKIRYLKYKLSNTLISCQDFNKFIATKEDNISTIGEETLDFFDIDIGF